MALIKKIDIHTLWWLLAFCLLMACNPKRESVVRVAVAANFTAPAQEIAKLFEEREGSRVVLSFGSTGQLFTQITQDAPFDLFLAADEESPQKIVAEGLGLADSTFTYAVGKLVLFSTTLDLTNGEATLNQGNFERIAIANPVTAPYGAAAIEAIKSLGLGMKLAGKIVQGNNIAQTFQFVETGNAELGFVALSQVLGKSPKSIWVVPQNLYSPIRQDAVLLRKGSENEAARSFISFLKSPEIVKIIERYGYSGTH